MKMNKIDDRTVKVVLSFNDMSELSINYDEMNYENPVTKKAIAKIIEQINKELNLCLISHKLFIEAYPYADGGCILFINMLDLPVRSAAAAKKYHTSQSASPSASPGAGASSGAGACTAIYAFSDLDALGKLAHRLGSFDKAILKNSLYYCAGKKEYYLVISTCIIGSDKLVRVLCEYGKPCGKGVLIAAIIAEHSKEIIKADAINILTRCL